VYISVKYSTAGAPHSKFNGLQYNSFERIGKETGAEYGSKGLSSWSQFVGMLFCQLGRAHSLREIEGGL